MLRIKTLLGIAFLASILINSAQAALMVNIGGTIVGGSLIGGTTYADNQAGVDSNPTVGVLDIGAFLDTVAVQFRINGFTALSASPIASLAMTANVNLLQKTVLPISVDVFVTDNGFAIPKAPLSLNQTVNLLSAINGLEVTSTAKGYFGDSNLEFDVDGDSTSNAKGSVKKGIAINSPGISGLIIGPNLYSLTSHVNLQVLSRGSDPIQNLQVNSNLAATGSQIPEPYTGTLILGGLLALAGFKKLR